MGYPFFDCALEALSGNLMAFPGLPGLVGGIIRKAVQGFVWPQRMIIPLAKDESGTGYANLLPWPEGVLVVRLRGARRLPLVDLGGSIDPFFKLKIDGHVLVRHSSALSSLIFLECAAFPASETPRRPGQPRPARARPSAFTTSGRASRRHPRDDNGSLLFPTTPPPHNTAGAREPEAQQHPQPHLRGDLLPPRHRPEDRPPVP